MNEKLSEMIPEEMSQRKAIDVLYKLSRRIPEEKVRKKAITILDELSKKGFRIQVTREEVMAVFNTLQKDLPYMSREEALVEMDKLLDTVPARYEMAKAKAKAEGRWYYGLALDGNISVDREVMMEVLTEAAWLQVIIDGKVHD